MTMCGSPLAVEGWDTIVDRWGVTIAVVTADNPGLRDRLVSAGWAEIYADADGSVLQPKWIRTFGERETSGSPARFAPDD